MGSYQDNNDFYKYRKDITTIKNILMKIEEKPLFEPWVFFAWSFLSFIMALFHYLAATYFQLSLQDILIKIWLPIIVISYAIEPFAVIKRMTKEAIPLFSRTIIKLYLGVAGHSIASLMIIILIMKMNALCILPATLFFLASIFCFIYAQVAYSSFFFYGFLMIFVGILFSIFNIAMEIQFISIPIILGLMTLVMGVMELRKEKK